ncbi:MAG TPA: DUF2332 domain-containing protein [Streptosporangiaceae bacterium]|nr:DUF2332 domain-containing protein [Streptosporangiaceae bacterium]
MTGLEPGVGIAENYRRFARVEAAGRSPAYERLALAVADDPVVLGFLLTLPALKRQPNLLFAAASFLLGTAPGTGTLRRLVTESPAQLTSVMLARRTQTNEAARCATLLPALAGLPEPLALLEVGAAAGLTLQVDRYSYDYGGHRVAGTDPQAPTLWCDPRGSVPLPARVPEVCWRAGLDLNPLDAGADDDVRWLTCLLWPGESGRAERLSAALATARRHRVPVYQGDLLDDLERVATQAPAAATLVVYHSAVLGYVAEARRRAFGAAVRALGAVWLSNEGPEVVAGVTPPAVSEAPGGDGEAGRQGGFLLVRDGTHPLARTNPHGMWLEWLA